MAACSKCNDTLSVNDPQAEYGLAPCPDCTTRLPHQINSDNKCVYCDMFYPEGACPSIHHPNRITNSPMPGAGRCGGVGCS